MFRHRHWPRLLLASITPLVLLAAGCGGGGGDAGNSEAPRFTLGGSVSDAEFNNPQGVAVGARGEVYVADNGNNKVRKIAQD